MPKVESMQTLSTKLTTINRNKFRETYGKILNLLTLKVNEGELAALAEYYNAHFRRFTFQDFSLALTIEEFERI